MKNFCPCNIPKFVRQVKYRFDSKTQVYPDSDIPYILENQAVSGRWRAITRSHTRPSTENWKEELGYKLPSILITASWAPHSTENKESYGNRLPSIFRAIHELRMAMGENFTSADLEIFVYRSSILRILASLLLLLLKSAQQDRISKAFPVNRLLR